MPARFRVVSWPVWPSETLSTLDQSWVSKPTLLPSATAPSTRMAYKPGAARAPLPSRPSHRKSTVPAGFAPRLIRRTSRPEASVTINVRLLAVSVTVARPLRDPSASRYPLSASISTERPTRLDACKVFMDWSDCARVSSDCFISMMPFKVLNWASCAMNCWPSSGLVGS